VLGEADHVPQQPLSSHCSDLEARTSGAFPQGVLTARARVDLSALCQSAADHALWQEVFFLRRSTPASSGWVSQEMGAPQRARGAVHRGVGAV
jgi:hypothetical protein